MATRYNDFSERLCLRSFAFICAAALAVAGCVGGPEVQPGLASPQANEALGQDALVQSQVSEFIILPMDVLSVAVFREEGLSLPRVTVGSDGFISLPLLGSYKASGQSPREMESQLENLLGASYLRNPNVAVNVLETASHVVTVEGQVETPGIYNFQPGTRLSGAIALASGPTRVADAANIAVFRRNEEGLAIAKFDYRAMQSGTMIDPLLQPGDRVIVGTDSLSVFWQDALRSLPVFALFTQI